jgi:alkylhydroperoxidase family enzyme
MSRRRITAENGVGVPGRSLPLRALCGVLVAGLLLCCLPTHSRLWPFPENRSGPKEGDGLAALASVESPFAPLGHEACWTCLPARVRGEKGPLPLWARFLARSLPQTTAAMLELDYLHRTGDALPAEVRGIVRWAAAKALGSPYGEAVALGDLRAAGVGEDFIGTLTTDRPALSGDVHPVVGFVYTLTRAGHEVSDAQVAQLIERFGEKQVVAMVLLVAYANFQDRLTLALKIESEPDGPRPPLDVKFVRRRLEAVALVPPRRPPATPAAPDHVPPGPTEPVLNLAGIQTALAQQRCRLPRIRLPETDPGVNRWGLVGQTYQPELATAWSACTQAFGEESDQDPIFEQSLFWLVTRSRQCFY